MNLVRFSEQYRFSAFWEEQIVYKTNESGEKIVGILHPIIHWNGGYILTNLIAYKDSTIKVGQLLNLQEFKNYIEDDRILTTENRVIKDLNSNIECVTDFGIVTISNYKPRYSKKELYKKIEDYIEILNGKPCRRQKCLNSYKEYLLDNSAENWDRLIQHYEDIPKNDRVLYDYTETKDPLCTLITFKYKLTKEERIEYLKEDFEDEWEIEMVK